MSLFHPTVGCPICGDRVPLRMARQLPSYGCELCGARLRLRVPGKKLGMLLDGAVATAAGLALISRSVITLATTGALVAVLTNVLRQAFWPARLEPYDSTGETEPASKSWIN